MNLTEAKENYQEVAAALKDAEARHAGITVKQENATATASTIFAGVLAATARANSAMEDYLLDRINDETLAKVRQEVDLTKDRHQEAKGMAEALAETLKKQTEVVTDLRRKVNHAQNVFWMVLKQSHAEETLAATKKALATALFLAKKNSSPGGSYAVTARTVAVDVFGDLIVTEADLKSIAAELVEAHGVPLY